MPHRSEERPARGARRRDKGDDWRAKDSTGAGNERAVATTPDGRKSPSPWRRLSDVISERPWEAPGADPLLRDVLAAGLTVDAEPGDGAAAILPDGETLLFLVEGDGLRVKRHVSDDELRLFLGRAEVAA